MSIDNKLLCQYVEFSKLAYTINFCVNMLCFQNDSIDNKFLCQYVASSKHYIYIILILENVTLMSRYVNAMLMLHF